ncbi:MAG: beta-mannosidase [Ruminococcus sp.]|nr:beta-mannosidase [Ruminococcus sp.]
MMKRMTALCAAALMTLSLASCGSSDSSATASEGSEAIKAVTLYDDERHPVETQPVTESIGDLDLSEVQNEQNVSPDFKLEIEAETAELEAAAVLNTTSQGDFTGEGFVMLPKADSYMELSFELDQTGNYDVIIVAAGDSSSGGSGSLELDGEALPNYTIKTNKFSASTLANVVLPEGKHTFKFNGGETKLCIDSVTVTAAGTVDLEQFKVDRALINPDASEETKRLYNFLCDTYGKYTLSGQYSSDNMGPSCAEFYKINEETGKTPAVLGLDFIELSQSRVECSINREAYDSDEAYQAAVREETDKRAKVLIDQAEDWVLNQGGIVTFCWHWNAPTDYLDQSEWWKGFYSANTTFSLSKALKQEDQAGYDYLIRDIDSLARYLKVLDDNHVPILWRPLHEGGGDPKWHNPWFWWGSSGSGAYIELWKLLYDRLTNYHHINNLIWIWNGQDPDYYVGDDYCDIVGYDIYPEGGDTSSQKPIYDMMRETIGENKIIALTENGVIPDPDATFADGSRWSWFATWNGEFCINGDFELNSDYTPLETWVKIYNSDRVLTLDELPDLKSYPLDTEAFLAGNAS